MKAYYFQAADMIYPIFGVNSMNEAKEYISPEEWRYIVATDDEVYMNTKTGSVGFASDWDDVSAVVLVHWSDDGWVAI